MKRLMTICAYALSALLLALSCDKEPVNVEPSFPGTYREKTVVGGETVDFSFSANMDWTLSVEGSGAGSFFGILDNGMLEISVSGQAGEQKVSVFFTEDKDFDNDRVCSVVLKMGGKSKEIGKLIRLASNRSLAVFQAVAEEDGYKKEGDSYVYESESSSSLDFATVHGEANYILPVKLESNFPWIMNIDSDFITADKVESQGGSEEILFTLRPDASFATAQKVTVNLLTSSDANAKKYHFSLNVPALAERMECDLKEEYTFNEKGQLILVGGAQDLPAVGYILCAEGAKILALEWNEIGYYELEPAAWIHSSIELPSGSEGYMTNRMVKITVDENKGNERKAAILVLPAAYAALTPEAVCTDDGSAVKEEYLPYLASQLTQEGVVLPFFTVDESGAFENFKYSLEQDPSDYSWASAEFETMNVFKLTYSDQYSECHLILDKAFASYEIQDYDGNKVGDDWWLEFNPYGNNKKGAVFMTPGKIAEGAKAVSFIIFKDADGSNLAVLVCEYNESAGSGEDTSKYIFSLTQGTGAVKKLAAGDEDYDNFSMNFSTTEIYDVTVSSRTNLLDLVSTMEFWNINAMDDQYMAVDLANYEDFWVDPMSANQIKIRVPDTVTAKKHFYLLFMGENEKIIGIVRFTFDPDFTGGGSVSAPISFAYPDMVKNATLGAPGEDTFRIVKGEFGNTLSKDIVYELKYTGEAQMALLNVPSDPGAAWSNYPESADYWLTREMQGNNQMTVYMTEAGKIDFFAWMSNGFPTLILVCTAVTE